MNTDNISGPTPVALFPADLLLPGSRHLVEVDGVPIAIVSVDGNIYAFRNSCPHQGAPMIRGHITGTMLPAAPHEYRYGCDNEIIRCPLHGWEFDMNTGKSVFAPDKVGITSYEVYEDNGFIVLLTDRKRQPPVHSGVRLVCSIPGRGEAGKSDE